MRISLKEFQEATVARLVKQVSSARREVAEGGDPQAIALSAPTGSGKTVMITALMERIIEGDDVVDGDPNATFLWITDSPDLNEQSRRKIQETSSSFQAHQLVTIDSSFDQATFSPGRIYFLNTQKIGRDKSLVQPGDKRTHTLWQTVSNSSATYPGSFFVVLDEAHRGMTESRKDRELAASIVQKFIKGSPGEIPPTPLILGISATPDRFVHLTQGQQRLLRREDVEPEVVRESGLIKDKVLLYYPEEKQAADISVLHAAASKLKAFQTHWADYSDAGDEEVMPLLVVQVEDAPTKAPKGGGEKAISRTSLSEAVDAIEKILGPLKVGEIAHCFQEQSPIVLGNKTIPRIAPPDIQRDSNLRVVLFKQSLNTGWDCPRAEVMMSFRRAVDHTSIAQLVGRMVRTPLARRIESNDILNSVALYLPQYDKAGLKKVVEHLTQPSPDDQIAVEVEEGNEILDLSRAASKDVCFSAATGLPTYEIIRGSRASNSRRVVRLARALEFDKIQPGALQKAVSLITESLQDALHEATKDPAFNDNLDRSKEIMLKAVTVGFGGVEAGDGDLDESVALAGENVDDLFAVAGRKLGEGLHVAFAKCAVEGGASLSEAKLTLHVLLQRNGVFEQVETIAAGELGKLQQDYQDEILALPDGRRDVYRKIRRTAVKPEPGPLVLPDLIQVRQTDETWPDHLYSTTEGEFPAALNKWETEILQTAMASEDFVGWFRNPERKPWSLCVPYKLNGVDRGAYPDFLIFRKAGTGVRVDIVEPHRPNLDDFWAKARGLAEYAGLHGERFGRIEIVTILDGKKFRRLDLNEEAVRDAVRGVESNAHLRTLFQTHGV